GAGRPQQGQAGHERRVAALHGCGRLLRRDRFGLLVHHLRACRHCHAGRLGARLRLRRAVAAVPDPRQGPPGRGRRRRQPGRRGRRPRLLPVVERLALRPLRRCGRPGQRAGVRSADRGRRPDPHGRRRLRLRPGVRPEGL
ncbi:MAG: hypothetical protein AVDCRST_MAG10-3602, partial [uncultured Acidimicrobiales bacterium]